MQHTYLACTCWRTEDWMQSARRKCSFARGTHLKWLVLSSSQSCITKRRARTKHDKKAELSWHTGEHENIEQTSRTCSQGEYRFATRCAIFVFFVAFFLKGGGRGSLSLFIVAVVQPLGEAGGGRDSRAPTCLHEHRHVNNRTASDFRVTRNLNSNFTDQFLNLTPHWQYSLIAPLAIHRIFCLFGYR